MFSKKPWNDQLRDNLREAIQRHILGELRLAKHDHEEIWEYCHEGQIVEACPKKERATFNQFAADELDRILAQLESEQAQWPPETDSDRLDRVELALRDRGIMLWQASPCCDTCTVGELTYRIEEIEQRCPGFTEQMRGYAFFIDQNMPEMLAESTQISVYLGYGWYSEDNPEVAPEIYEQKALGIAREVCESLREEGFEVDWDGDFSRKIGLSLNWQRRTMLE